MEDTYKVGLIGVEAIDSLIVVGEVGDGEGGDHGWDPVEVGHMIMILAKVMGGDEEIPFSDDNLEVVVVNDIERWVVMFGELVP